MDIVMAIAGALSLYLGYKLFSEAGRFTNLAAGALLALFGLGILIADIRDLRPTARHASPAWQKKSNSKGKARAVRYPEHLV